MPKKMISVCLTTHNGEEYIKEQLDSIVCQLKENDEIIISDDRSIDKTIKIIESLNDKRIKIFKNNKSKGVINNFENSLEKAKGEYIFLSDQDDVWLPNKIEIFTKELTNYDLVMSDCFVTDQYLNIIHDSFYCVNNSFKSKYGAFIRNSYLGCCMAFNRTILQKTLPFPKDIPMHDIWIGNVAAFNYKVKFIPDKLIYYRRHDNNISTTSEKSKNTVSRKISFRLNIIINLTKRVLK